ncbi:hypothetical protein EVAR_29493_1 [Eumeta japonica]|uniref:BZIP domain-containing protein n=1 Tax=Eumeta variegata TaxID=151549 RepID=A0A4C1WWC2_EUMVA|nr:hypothetical protein EVAR_29493_1 [Eumeta japonica]
MPPAKSARRAPRGVSDADDESEDYRRKRDRNNEAVKKSRHKSKQKTQETFTRVNKLKAENQVLEEKVSTLTRELQFLKELFLAHASNKQSSKFENVDLEKLLQDVDNIEKKEEDSK